MNKLKVTKTNLEIPVKPVSDRNMTEEEFRQRIAEIQKDRETMQVLDKLAEQEVTKRKPHGPVQQQRRAVPRYVQPQQPLRGLLAPAQSPKGFMGLLVNTPDRSKG